MILLNIMKEEKFIGWNFFAKLLTGTKKNDMSAMFPLSCAAAQCEMVPRTLNFLFRRLLEAAVFLLVLNFIVPFKKQMK